MKLILGFFALILMGGAVLFTAAAWGLVLALVASATGKLPAMLLSALVLAVGVQCFRGAA